MIWINGSLIDSDAARISPLDHGMLVGDGIFETLRTELGLVFAFERHMRRLGNGCARMGLAPVDPDAIAIAIDQVLSANQLQNARIRVTVTSGAGPLGSDRGTHQNTVIVAASELPKWPATAAVVLSPWLRNPNGATTGIKTTSYAENVLALADAHQRGADEAIYRTPSGELCEGTGSNIFLIANGTLKTPPLAAGCLPGVTRGLVLELASERNIVHSEAPIPAEALFTADLAFLTSTTRTLQAIHRVDDHQMPSTEHPTFMRLLTAFRDLPHSV